MTKRIPLSQGLFALVDDEDFEVVSQLKWHALKGGERVYARSIKGRPLHRFLLNPDRSMEVDHINGDGLDNRRSNLRLCTRSQNAKNRSKHKDASSKFKGVHLTKWGWRAAIVQNGNKLNLGTFSSEDKAARQYDRAARLCFGVFAKTNASLGLLA